MTKKAARASIMVDKRLIAGSYNVHPFLPFKRIMNEDLDHFLQGKGMIFCRLFPSAIQD